MPYFETLLCPKCMYSVVIPSGRIEETGCSFCFQEEEGGGLSQCPTDWTLLLLCICAFLLQQHQQRAYCATILPFNLKCLPASKAIASEKNAKIPIAAVAAYTKTVKLGGILLFF